MSDASSSLVGKRGNPQSRMPDRTPSAAFARDRLEAAVREYVRGGFQPHDVARLVSEIATEMVGQKEWAES